MERTKDRIWPVTAPGASTAASTEQESDEEVPVPGDGVQLTEEGSEKETAKPSPAPTHHPRGSAQPQGHRPRTR